MNVYVVTEGIAEQKVYVEWIPLINDRLVQVTDLDQVVQDTFYLVSGNGYPSYFEMISNAIEDVNRYTAFSRLVVSVDSEDMTREEKLAEVEEFVSDKGCRVEVVIVVQHFCFEAWALGNRKIVRPNTQSVRLKRFRQIHDVRTRDPELLPPLDEDELTRAQFAAKYLRAALNDKHRNLTYTKKDPAALKNPKYLEQLRLRLQETGHIRSFEDFLNAFA